MYYNNSLACIVPALFILARKKGGGGQLQYVLYFYFFLQGAPAFYITQLTKINGGKCPLAPASQLTCISYLHFAWLHKSFQFGPKQEVFQFCYTFRRKLLFLQILSVVETSEVRAQALTVAISVLANTQGLEKII